MFYLLQDVVDLFHKVLRSGPEKESHLKALSRVLRDPSAQLTFTRHEMSLWVLFPVLSLRSYFLLLFLTT